MDECYPAGAPYCNNTPWNYPDVPEMNFNVTCSQSLSKTVTVSTNNYIPHYEKSYMEGVCFSDVDADTSNTDWSEEYAKNHSLTPSELLLIFKRYLQDEVDGTTPSKKDINYMKRLIKECSNWIVDETEFVQED